MGRWCKGFKEFVFGCNARSLPPRVILTSARVGPYHGCMHIYIRPYTVPPTTLIPRSRISGLQGSQGHRVTKATEPQNHRATESRRRKVTGSPNIQVSKYPRIMGSQGHPSHIITWSLGHWVIGSLGHWVTGSLGYWVICHTRLSPWLRSPGSPGSQGYPGSRVT